MIRTLVAGVVVLLVAQGPAPVSVTALAKAPVMDGHVAKGEYGPATLKFTTRQGEASVWMRRHGGFVYIAATLPDTSMYWGDDFVISMDLDGNAGSAPDVGDRQFYLRRALDSSVVFVVDAPARGHWLVPGQMPPLLRATRHTADWDVAGSSSPSEWSVELRVKESLFSKKAQPRIAFRTYNDKPKGWTSLPKASVDSMTIKVERNPSLWIPLRLR
ncbi:MAG: hypothetical protein ABIY52_08005 [Gemmatimonadaceae bacterium]